MHLPLLLAAALPVFLDVTPDAGIAFRHDKSPTSRKYLIESVTGGLAMIDYDSDGLLDLYFVNAAQLNDPMKPSQFPAKSDPKFWNRLYRNKGGFRFEDVTEKAGLRGRGYGMGAAVGDYNNDGHPDLYLTNYGTNILYRNRGDGTFEDVTDQAGVQAGGWSSSAAWLDFDSDGLLDLIVARYLQWDFQPDLWCGSRKEGYRSYCHPDQFQPITHILYRNRGDGTFEDFTDKSGWAKSPGKGLGIALNDFDRDGKTDIVVANDSFPQQLFHNLGAGRFREIGLEAGIAYDEDGHVFGGMGVDFADYDNDGWPDIFINALAMQRYALFRNLKGLFEYASTSTNVGPITRMRSGWGAKFIDYDNDGWRDIFVAQGHVMDNIQLTQPSLKYLEPPLLMRNIEGRFHDVSSTSGDVFSRPLAARGAAFGDLDNDGFPDVAINCNNGPPVILRNRGGNGHHWLIVDAGLNIGAHIRIVAQDGRQQRAIVNTAGSYLSSNDPRVHFGLGAAASVALIEAHWPNGEITRRENIPANRIIRLLPPRRP
jgi:hypothetical protein